MQIKLYTFDELLERHTRFVDDEWAYSIPKGKYSELTEHPQEVLRDNTFSFFITEGYYIPHSFVKEIIE